MLLGTTALAEIQIDDIVDEFNIYASMLDGFMRTACP
jgi:hypothetical protein